MILLTGATGYVGRHLAAELVRRGVAVRGLVRRRSRATALAELGVELVEGDVLRPASLALAADGCDAVVHLVGLLREGWRTTFDRVVVEGSRNVIAACCDRRVPRLAYVSALGVHPDSPSRYFATKGEVERLVRASGLTYQIWRPSLMLGRGEMLTDDLIRLLRRSPVMPLLQAPAGGRLQPLMIDDAVAIMGDLLVSDGAWNATYEIAGPEPLTIAEITRRIAAALGRRPLAVPIPTGPLRLATRLLAPVAPLLPVTADQLRMMAVDGTTDDEEYRRFSSVVPLSIEEGVRRMVRAGE